MIGSIYPTSGPQRAGGTDEERGVRLAVEWANTHGGVRGRSVRLETADAPRPEAVPSAMRVLRDRGVRVVIGSHGSATSVAAAEVAGETGMMLWETGAVGGTRRGQRRPQLLPARAHGRQPRSRRHRLRPRPARAQAAAGGAPPLRRRLRRRPLRPRRSARGRSPRSKRSGQVLAASLPYDARHADFAALARRIADDAHRRAVRGLLPRRRCRAACVPSPRPRCRWSPASAPARASAIPSSASASAALAVGMFASDKPDQAHVRPDALAPEGRRTLAWASARYQRRYGTTMSAEALGGFSNGYSLLAHVLPGGDLVRPGGRRPRRARHQAARAARSPTAAASTWRRPVRPTRARTAAPPASSGSGWRRASGRSCGPRRSPHTRSSRCAPGERRARPPGGDDLPSIGLGLAAAYALVCLTTLRVTGHDVRPLFEGIGPDSPYRWVNPPEGVRAGERQARAPRAPTSSCWPTGRRRPGSSAPTASSWSTSTPARCHRRRATTGSRSCSCPSTRPSSASSPRRCGPTATPTGWR